MSVSQTALFLSAFATLEDPRVERTKLHALPDLLAVALCAMIGGAATWDEVEAFGNAKIDWFQTFLPLENGIPSHDTFGRVFARINPEHFQTCFLTWIQQVCTLTTGEVVAIDGKTLRSSYDLWDGKAAIHMVSAWAAENRMVLGQVKVDEKSNEITAIPALLRVIDVAGCIVTIDAMGCQTDIVAIIIEEEADYVISVKENQQQLYDDIARIFAEKLQDDLLPPDVDVYRSEDHKHGRDEVRTTWTTADLTTLAAGDCWAELTSIGMVRSERTINGKTSIEHRYYISSLESDAQRIGETARTHWGIENQLHWVLDVAFREDSSRICKDHGPQNVAIVRHIALNLLRQEKTSKASIRAKRLRAGWDNEYLAKVMQIVKIDQDMVASTK